MVRIVKLNDNKPLVLTAKDVSNGPVAVCRCGLSTDWPWCDGTHKETRTEAEGETYAYTRDPKTKALQRRIANAADDA